uniref:Uncharacterized protein n=1 Tax=Nelumbo nucifera TaxID=4432 RepID=A0A822YDA4_NELNU|nr:TPA_asm: hypothetical protein HUJ06_010965 [Nelumbo nucifera]
MPFISWSRTEIWLHLSGDSRQIGLVQDFSSISAQEVISSGLNLGRWVSPINIKTRKRKGRKGDENDMLCPIIMVF